MSNLPTIKQMITNPASQKQIALALPPQIDVEFFQRVAITAVNNSYGIGDCEPSSVMNALVKCAQDGLLPDGREAALVKYGRVAQYMPMVGGVLKKMRNSGQISDVNAHIVYSNEQFDITITDGIPHVTHKPEFRNRGDFELVYGVVLFKDGTKHIEYMTKEDVDKHRAKAKSKNVWDEWYEEMAKKTVIHRLAKRVPTSASLIDLIDRNTKDIAGETEEAPQERKKSMAEQINESIIEAEYTEEDHDGRTEEDDSAANTEINAGSEDEGATPSDLF